MFVDMRLRPPVPSLVKSTLYQSTGLTEHPRFPRLPSTRERSIPMLLSEMDDAGIAIGVVPGRYSLEPFGTTANDELANLFRDYPGRFVGFLGLDLRWDTQRMLDEVARWIGQPGFVGVSIEPTISLEPSFSSMDDKRLYPIYEECVKRGVPINVTLSAVLQGITEQPLELSRPRQAYPVAMDFPKLQIHIAHAAYPWVTDMVALCMTCPNVWLSPDLYMADLFPGAQDYARLALNYAPRRTLFGSNYPTKPFKPMLQAYRDWGWPEEVQRQVLGENARRLLQLD